MASRSSSSAHRVDRARESLGVGQRQLQRELAAAPGDARRVAEPGTRERSEVVSGLRGGGAHERDGDGVRQMADPGHETVVAIRGQHDRPRADAADELGDDGDVVGTAARGLEQRPGAVAEELRVGGLDALAP